MNENDESKPDTKNFTFLDTFLFKISAQGYMNYSKNIKKIFEELKKTCVIIYLENYHQQLNTLKKLIKKS